MGWVRIDNTTPDHPKLVAAGPEAAWLWVAGLCYCSRQETDGRIPKGVIHRLTDIKKPAEAAERLITVGLWEDDPGCYIVLNYLEYQRSKDEIESIREQKREAGSRGGKASAAKRWGPDSVSKPQAEGKHSAYSPVQAKSNPHTQTHTQEVQPYQKEGFDRCFKCGELVDDDGYCIECSAVSR